MCECVVCTGKSTDTQTCGQIGTDGQTIEGSDKARERQMTLTFRGTVQYSTVQCSAVSLLRGMPWFDSHARACYGAGNLERGADFDWQYVHALLTGVYMLVRPFAYL
jgi:hypothetical protein